jgi:membrane protease YdiL (CAAX protease family)
LATALAFGPRVARVGAEVAALTLSSLAFAAAHFAPFTRWFDLAPREFQLDAFTWLCLGGLALGLIFRWRGPGVAAWAHALFNVALWIGIDPDVIW